MISENQCYAGIFLRKQKKPAVLFLEEDGRRIHFSQKIKLLSLLRNVSTVCRRA